MLRQQDTSFVGKTFLTLILAAAAARVVDASDFRLTPAAVSLQGNFSQAQILVTEIGAAQAAERASDLTTQATYATNAPSVASVDAHGRLRAVSNGHAEIKVTVDGITKSLPVEVDGVVAEPYVSFRTQVLPILSKAGCNAGACHASQYGKGGFKLSVFGYAPDEDYEAIVRARLGGRVNLLEPELSLFLLKPTRTVPHGGNRRLEVGSDAYRILCAWLYGGAPAPASSDPDVASVQVFPAERVGSIGFKQQLKVLAHYTDGQTRDVTAWAKFDTMDDSVVQVSSSGLVEAVGRGQSSVMVRFEGQAAVSTAVIPYATGLELAGWQDNNYIDRLAGEKFRELGITPSPQCDDATFLRRSFLDVTGTMPTREETVAFLDSTDPEKRPKLVNALLGFDGPVNQRYVENYAAYWSIKWSDLLRSTSRKIGEQSMWAMHNWLKGSLRNNKPYDQFVRELLTAQGSSFSCGPANYYRITDTPPDMAETTAQLFLGVRLQCARCHHHPYEKYGQADYYRFAASFARIGVKDSAEFGLFGGEKVIAVNSSGSVHHPRTNQIMQPANLDGQAIEACVDERQPLAQWIASKDNHFFARNIANRYMAYFLGRGLVEPVDDLRATNPASNAALMDAIAAEFVKSNFDLKRLIRDIMTSRLYQLDSQPTADNAHDSRFYSHYGVKRLAAEPLLDAIDYATGVPTKFQKMPAGTRAIELPDTEYGDYFLKTFGKPRRATVCECERVSAPNLSQALNTLNGDILAGKIADSKGRIATLVDAKKPFEEIVSELYLVTLCRRPTDRELEAGKKFFSQTANPRGFYEDLLWSLINSKQFLFIR